MIMQFGYYLFDSFHIISSNRVAKTPEIMPTLLRNQCSEKGSFFFKGGLDQNIAMHAFVIPGILSSRL